jgi:YesN/AraC family two-component response regulator
LFPATLILWKNYVYAILALYLFLPLIPMARNYSSKYVIYGAICSVLAIVAILITVNKVEVPYVVEEQNLHTVYILNTIIIIMVLLHFALFFCCYFMILKVTQDKSDSSVEVEEKVEQIENTQEKELYNKVIAYFETKQPYKQVHYSLSMCASDLNTNTKYLSDAINTYYGTFDNLLNKYRLEFVKQMLDEHLADKYTIEYIYTLAGYHCRSTFYKNFYKAFRTTPLEYQRMLKS